MTTWHPKAVEAFQKEYALWTYGSAGGPWTIFRDGRPQIKLKDREYVVAKECERRATEAGMRAALPLIEVTPGMLKAHWQVGREPIAEFKAMLTRCAEEGKAPGE